MSLPVLIGLWKAAGMLILNILLLQVVGKYSCRNWVCEWSVAGRGWEEPKSKGCCRGGGKRPVKCEFWKMADFALWIYSTG